MAKFGCRCECGVQFSRGTPGTRNYKTREQYALAKMEHATKCAKMWDLLKNSGKQFEFVRPAEGAKVSEK